MEWMNVMTIIVSKMTSHCAGAVQIREDSESGIKSENLRRDVI